MVCSEGSVGIPQNMMLVSMVHSSREKQQDTRCTRVNVLQGGRLMTENQMWPSRKSLAVFMKNRLLESIEKKRTFGFRRDNTWTTIRNHVWQALPKSLQIHLRGYGEDLVQRALSHIHSQPGVTQEVPLLTTLQILHHYFVDIPACDINNYLPCL